MSVNIEDLPCIKRIRGAHGPVGESTHDSDGAPLERSPATETQEPIPRARSADSAPDDECDSVSGAGLVRRGTPRTVDVAPTGATRPHDRRPQALQSTTEPPEVRFPLRIHSRSANVVSGGVGPLARIPGHTIRHLIWPVMSADQTIARSRAFRIHAAVPGADSESP